MKFNSSALSGYSLFICLSLFLCILSYLPLPLLSRFHSFTFSPPLSGHVYRFLIKVMSQWVDASRASNTLRQFVSAHVTFQTGSVSLSRVLWTMSHWCPSVLSHYTLVHHSLTITMSLYRVRKCVILLMQLQDVYAQKTHTQTCICMQQGERASGKC